MRSTPEPVVVVENLVAGYGDHLVLDDVSLTIHAGEVLVILGGSGCGKSTLLRCIVGLLTPRSGTIRIRGREMVGAGEAEREQILRDVGLAFQEAALLNSMTVAENIALPIMEHWDIEEETALVLARMRLARVGLARAGDKMPSELSGGMRKRAGIARAIALEPSLLLLDEPSAGLDPTTARALDELILELGRRGSMAIGCVTHELGSIETITTRAIMLASGKIIAEGPLDRMRASPDARVQAFFHRALVEGEQAGSVLDALEGQP